MRPTDLIRSALRAIGVAGVGSTVSATETNDAFDTLNGMLDQWSIQKLLVGYQNEIVHPLAANIDRYTIGPNGSIGALIAGQIVAPNILVVTDVPLGTITRGMQLSTSVPGTRIQSFLTGGGGNGARAVGTYQVTPNQTLAAAAIAGYYERPVSIRQAFVRTNVGSQAQLDYPVNPLASENWQKIGQKNLQGPWPQALYYQATEQVANLFYWPVPTNSASEMHLFADAILSRFGSVSEDITLPQGMELALRYNLAALLMVDYAVTDQGTIAMITDLARKGMALLKAANQVPSQMSGYDSAIVTRNASNAGWILTAGFAPT